MATAITGTNILDQMLDEVEGLGWKFQGTATSGSDSVSATDPEINKGGSGGYVATRFDNQFLYIPSGTVGTDQVHSIDQNGLSVSGATALLQTLGNYNATYTSAAMYLLSLHPDEIRRTINDALEREFTNLTLPLVDGTDWDMQVSGVSNWDTAGGGTPTKVTALPNVLYGLQSLRVLSSAADEYVTSPFIFIPRGRALRAWAISRSDVGTAKATVIDRDLNVLATMSHTEENWNYTWVEFNNTTAKEVAFRLGGVGTTDDSYWQAIGIEKVEERVRQLPAWADERFKVSGISHATFFGSTDGNNTHQAMSRQLRALRPDIDWRYESEQVSANPHYIELIGNHVWRFNSPLFVTGFIPYSYFGELTTDASTTYIPLEQAVARATLLLAQRHETWSSLIPMATAAIRSRQARRQTNPPDRLVTHNRMMRY